MARYQFRTLAFILSLFAIEAQAENTYRFVDLGAPANGYSAAYGINDKEQVVGYARDSIWGSGNHTAVLWSSGKAIALSAYDQGQATARAINNAGQIVGINFANWNDRGIYWNNGTPSTLSGGGVWSFRAWGINDKGQIAGGATHNWNDYPRRPTLWDNGRAVDLGVGPGISGIAYGINNLGDVVGFIGTRDLSLNYAALWSDNQTIILPNLDSSVGFALPVDINDRRQIVGHSYVSDIPRATFWENNQVIDLGTLPNGTRSIANAINDRGDIVGWSEADAALGGSNAVLWSNGKIIDLNSLGLAPGWHLKEATAINNLGSIVGIATNASGMEHAFLLTVSPVPEPETYGMVLGSLTLFGVLRRRIKGTRTS